MAAVVAHHALRLGRGARRVEDVERISRFDRHAVGGLAGPEPGFPPPPPLMIAPPNRVAFGLWALEDQPGLRLAGCERDRFVEQRFVSHHAAELDTATRR